MDIVEVCLALSTREPAHSPLIQFFHILMIIKNALSQAMSFLKAQKIVVFQEMTKVEKVLIHDCLKVSGNSSMRNLNVTNKLTVRGAEIKTGATGATGPQGASGKGKR